MKLNQVIAREKSVKKAATEALTKAYQKLGHNQLFNGMNRTYRPFSEDGEQLPPETVQVQTSVTDLLSTLEQDLAAMMDTVLQKDKGNCQARASVVVDGKTILEDVPAVSLLFLEKQLEDLATFVSKLPTLDPAEEWVPDTNSGKTYRTPAQMVNRTKKVPRNHVKAAATDKHPAQVEMYYEDVAVGQYHTVKFSGAVPVVTRDTWLKRVRELQRAVKCAREEANLVETPMVSGAGSKVLAYVFNQ